MNSPSIILKWQNYFWNDKELLKELKKYENVNLHETDFLSHCQVINKKICSLYGVGLNKINTLTVRSFFYSFINFFDTLTCNDFVFIASDGTTLSKKLLSDITHIKSDNAKFISFDKFKGFDKKMISEAIKKTKSKLGFYIQQSLYNKNIINIYFLDENGNDFNNELINEIVKKTNSFDKFKIPLRDEKEIYFIDNKKMIEIFVEKTINLYNQKTINSASKITISNHNKGLTEILSTLVAKLDFSYVVNKKVKYKNIFEKNLIDDKSIKFKYKDEINFARKNKSNILITFNSNGTNLLLFLVNKKQSIFVNENLLSLIFLHHFFNKLYIENKKILNMHISSNIEPIKPIKNLIKKYDLDFKRIDEISCSENNYLLFYWNSYNQYIFGEKRNTEFCIYYIIIKLLEILNFYNLQDNGINSMFSNLKKMYDSYNEIKIISDLTVQQINQTLDKINNSVEIQEKLKIKFIKKYVIDDFNNKTDENILWSFDVNDNVSLTVKFNVIRNKIIFIYRKKDDVKKIFNYLTERKLCKKMIKNIFYNNEF